MPDGDGCEAGRPFWRRGGVALCLIGLLMLAPALAACGKKGPPVPDYSSRLFSWRNVSAVMSADGCLSVSGFVDGASHNLSHMVLEVQALDDVCDGCPFSPQETYMVTAAEAWEDPSGEKFRFAWCPSDATPGVVAAMTDAVSDDGAEKARGYRWRLVGRNIFTSLPPVLTPVRDVHAPTASPAG